MAYTVHITPEGIFPIPYPHDNDYDYDYNYDYDAHEERDRNMSQTLIVFANGQAAVEQPSPSERAEKLFLDSLTTRQRMSWVARDYLYVTAYDGTLFRLRNRMSYSLVYCIRVGARIYPLVHLCVQPDVEVNGEIPVYDRLYLIKTLLETPNGLRTIYTACNYYIVHTRRESTEFALMIRETQMAAGLERNGLF